MTAIGGRTGLVRVLAWRRITARPLRSCLTALGVAAGVAFLFSIISLNAQLTSNVRDTAALLSAPGLLQVTPASPGGLPDGLTEKLASDPRVAAAAPVVLARSTASNGSHEIGVFVLGLTPDAASLSGDAVDTLDVEVSALATTRSGVAVSRSVAHRLGVELDDNVTIHAATGATDLPVLAVASSPLVDRVNGGMAMVMPLDVAQRLFGRGDRVDQVFVLAKPGADVDALRRDLEAATNGAGIVGAPGEVMGAGSRDFAGVRMLTNLTGLVVVLAALTLVFHTMSMATAERRTEIGLARSLGSSRKQLLLVTLTEAGLLGAAGVVVGLVAGGALARLVVPLARFAYAGTSPVDVPTAVALEPGMAAVAAVAGLAGAILGAVVPARAAARATPIEALRPTATYEWRDPSRPARRLTIAAGGAFLLVAGLALGLRGTSGDMENPTTILPVALVYASGLVLVPLAVPYVARLASRLLTRLSSTTGRLAGDALQANSRRTVINVMALLLPVTIVIMTAVSFNSGLSGAGRLARAVVGAPVNVDADSYVGGPGGAVASQPLAATQQSKLEAIPGVRAVLPYENANIKLPDESLGVVYAIPIAAAQRSGVEDMVQVPRLSDDPAAFTKSLSSGGIAASHFAARNLHLRPGSRLSLPTPSGDRTFTVGALFDDWAFQGTFYIDLDTYRSVWGDDGAYRYGIVPTADSTPDELQRRVEAVVASAGMPAQVHSRAEAVEQLKANTTSLLPLVQGISLASLIFGALALASAAFTAITERRWNIALQRTLGMTRRQVTRSLVLEAVTVGLVGAIGATVVGLALGAYSVRFLGDQIAMKLPYEAPWVLVVLAAIIGVAVAACATAYPRRIARRLSIIEALRFD